MQRKIHFLDGLRGIAAFYVMAGHARWLLWEGFNEGYLKNGHLYSSVDKLCMYFLSLFKWGHEFVLFFFVLSGFVIHLGYAKKLTADPEVKISIKEYLYKRIKRIYPPFLFAIFLTALLDFIGSKYGFSIYSGDTPYSSINKQIGNTSHSISTLFGNILFLFPEYVPRFGTNGPTWSLKFEWWFYILYIPFLFMSRKNIYLSTGLVVLLFVVSFFPGIWPVAILQTIFSSMLCWWFGVLIAEVVAGRLKIPLLYLTGAFLVGFVGLFLFKSRLDIADLRTAFFFSALLSFFLWYNNKEYSLRLLERLKPLGDFSYTLYIIHFPILVFLSGIILKINNNYLPRHSWYVFAGMVVCIVIAYLCYFLVEVPFMKPLKSGSEARKKKDVSAVGS
ncbi:acyltransferase family protein [Chitinophaga tropicalis]|nr:acyltransferase [Chitinophaga tropicalis]